MDPDSPSSTAAGQAGRIAVDLALEDPAWLDDLPDAEALAERAATAALDWACPGPALSLALVLSDDAHLRELNRDWRGMDKPTNVLSFPSQTLTPDQTPRAEPGMPAGMAIELGDVIVALGTMVHEARDAGRPLGHHLCHLVVHGTLHLLGYDHEQDDDAETMEAMERDILAGLGIPDPYT
jgi:probable rRNA maturation factor